MPSASERVRTHDCCEALLLSRPSPLLLGDCSLTCCSVIASNRYHEQMMDLT